MAITRVSEQGYTLAEAAETLRVPKKTLRHVLTRPDRKARLLREYRNTKKGLVTVEVIPADLFAEIENALRTVAAPAEEDEREEPITDESAGSDEEDAEPRDVVAAASINLSIAEQPAAGEARLIMRTYERLLAEKESRLADLRAALETERENARTLADALAREQANVAALSQRLATSPASEAPSKTWISRLFGGK